VSRFGVTLRISFACTRRGFSEWLGRKGDNGELPHVTILAAAAKIPVDPGWGTD
jgi:hypothetical protein